MFRETITAILALLLVGGLVGRLVRASIGWIKKLYYSPDKMYGVFFVHLLLISALVAFGLFVSWIFQPMAAVKNISDFIGVIIVEMIGIISGDSLIFFFERKEGNKEGEKK